MLATPDWLTTQLRAAGILAYGTVTAVHTGEMHSFTVSMIKLALEYSPDAPPNAPAQLVLKQHIRQPEVDFHQQIAPKTNGNYILRCYTAGIDEASDTRYMLMADLSETHVEPPDTLPQPQNICDQLIDILADFHAQWWGYAEPTQDVLGFVRQTAEDTFPRMVDELGDRLSDQRRHWFEQVMASPTRHTNRLISGENVTLVHGDTHYWNFLYPRTPGGQIYLLDWAVWHRNLPASDLSYQIAQLCSPERRARIERPLMQRYHEQLQVHGITTYSWDQCWHDYRLSLVEHTLWVMLWYQFAPISIWWRALENFMSAFDDLDCQELL